MKNTRKRKEERRNGKGKEKKRGKMGKGKEKKRGEMGKGKEKRGETGKKRERIVRTETEDMAS